MEKVKEDNETDNEKDNDDKSLGATCHRAIRKMQDVKDPLLPAFNIIVDNMHDDWMDLGYRLALSRADILATDDRYGGDPKVCCRDVLWQWRNKTGGNATWMKLQEIVSDAGHKDVSEKMQKELCYFNLKDSAWQDPMDAPTLLFLKEKMSGIHMLILQALLQSTQYQGDKESKEQYEQRMAMSKEARAFVDSIKIKIGRDLLSGLSKVDRELGRDAHRERELVSARENNMPDQVKGIKMNSRQKNHDSGFVSRALQSRTSSAANRSLARAENNQPLNNTEEEEQSEDSSSDEDSYETASEGESPVQTANTSIIQVFGDRNTIITTGSGCVINANV